MWRRPGLSVTHVIITNEIKAPRVLSSFCPIAMVNSDCNLSTNRLLGSKSNDGQYHFI
jgi:hypothetical protein